MENFENKIKTKHTQTLNDFKAHSITLVDTKMLVYPTYKTGKNTCSTLKTTLIATR